MNAKTLQRRSNLFQSSVLTPARWSRLPNAMLCSGGRSRCLWTISAYSKIDLHKLTDTISYKISYECELMYRLKPQHTIYLKIKFWLCFSNIQKFFELLQDLYSGPVIISIVSFIGNIKHTDRPFPQSNLHAAICWFLIETECLFIALQLLWTAACTSSVLSWP